MGAITYRNVLAETEALFDYQLQQMALSLRDQGEIGAAQADSLADEQLDFVIQIWTVDGRSIYASRAACGAAGAGTARTGDAQRARAVPGAPSASATRHRVIQVAQPVEIRHRLAAQAALAQRAAAAGGDAEPRGCRW